MADPFIGEIRAFSFDFAPKDWAFCNGTLLPVNQNQALFSILGTVYGGDGIHTFALPDLRGRVPVHPGNGVSQGERYGEETHTLTITEMPAHTHMANANNVPGTEQSASGNIWAGTNGRYFYNEHADSQMNLNALSSTGGGQAHSNMQPYSVINYCIALVGIYPSRS
ncbi:phage tail protein [Marinicrinis sediminis]|uniref:Phage tail protein n=1 Tax=Marinicrinis sediminis TaxID=1652465 RepID=A0ABW5RG53_9BACL